MKNRRWLSILAALFLASAATTGCNTEDEPSVTNNGGTNNGGANNGGANNGGTNNGGMNNGGTNNGGTNNGGTNNGGTNNGCVPTEELCGDGADNDCDGEIDEGFEDLGQACTSGQGVCEASGMFVCSEDGTSLECDAAAQEPPVADEMTCDDLDNDCDGEIDEGCDDDMDGYCDADFTVVDTPAACPNGGDDCNDESADAFPGAPGICGDGIDNDCDGTADNFAGIDRMDPTFELAGAGAMSNSDGFPAVMASPSDTGFCVAVHDSGTGDIGMGHIDLTTNNLDFEIRARGDDPTLALHDIAWDGTSCAIVYTTHESSNSQNRSVEIVRYEPGATLTHRLRAVDQGATGVDHKFVALASTGSEWVIAYQVQGDQSWYVTVPSDFTFSSTSSTPLEAGFLGVGLELGPTPNPADDLLFVSTFFETHFHSIIVGSNAIERDGANFSSSKLHNWIHEIGGKVFWFGASGSSSEAREILDTYTPGNSGEVSFAAATDQEHVARHVASGGPQSSMWYADPFGDVAYTFEDNGTDLVFTDQSHPNLTGEVLAVTQSGDEVVVLTMTDAGTSGSMTQPATLTAYSYSCF